MPVNAGYEYGKALEKVEQAKTNEEKIKALQNLLSASPSHKGSEKLRGEIKEKIAKLREKVEKERSKKGGGGYTPIVKKEGAAQVTLIGVPNSGKSYLLNKLTGAKIEIADYPFTTKKPEVGVMDYEGVKIQLVEIPAIFEGFMRGDSGPSLLAIARTSDLIVIIVDGTQDCEKQIKIIENEFEKCFISLKKIRKENTENEIKKCLVVVNKVMTSFKCKYPVVWADNIKEGIWNMLDLVYVQTKTQGKKPDWPPVALEKGSTVLDLAENVHKDFVKNFKYARVWGKSVKHSGSNVGLEHVLKEGDIVEIHTK